MTQLLESLYLIAPYIFSAVLIGAMIGGIWLLTQVSKKSSDQTLSVSDRLFLKRNAARMRDMQFR